MRDGLLPRMEARRWADGKTVTYRYHPVGGKPIALGTDLQAALRKVLDLTGQAPGHGSLRWVWEQWVKSKRWAKLSASTHADYQNAWKQLDKHLGKFPMAAITSNMVARYVHIDRADSPRRADIEKALLSNLSKHAILLGVGTINPTIGVEPHGNAPVRVLPETLALKAFLEWLDLQTPQRRVIGRMAEFASLAGSRRVEFLDVAWTQVDAAAGVIRLPRAKQRGKTVFDSIKISARMQALLDRLPRDGAWLFTTRDGNPYTDEGFKTLWARCLRAAIEAKVITPAQRFTFHSLRRYYVTAHTAKHKALPNMHTNPRVTSDVYDATKEVERRAL